ncbi:MAG TPA: lamin tail domain-containing protein [Micromonosporaceae bacterium]|nr:lamin tail domain-containing protein [Micromonosporaceae bacterium]
MSLRTRVVTLATVCTVVGSGAAALVATPARAASPDVVLAAVYGGGGNTGATLTHDFIELHNRGAAPVSLTGWSVQYASAAGTSWQVTTLVGSIAAGGRFLVQEAAGAGGTVALPSPDVVGTIAMAAGSGKVALVTSVTPLGCGADCDAAAGVRDLLGYGTANDAETAPAPALSNTTAAVRSAGPDTDNNAADFTAGPPDPRGAGGGTPPEPGQPARIAEIQGAGHRSPLLGRLVTGVPGVVTAAGPRGFWIQDPQPDPDTATSDGLYVFTSTAPTVGPGDAVEVTGTVTEFRPGNDATNLSITQLTAPAVAVTGRGQPLPEATRVGPGGRVAPARVRADAPGDVETAGGFDPDGNAMDFAESMEGMLVRVVDAVAVGPTGRFGELAVLPGGSGSPRTARGGIRYGYGDPNTERVILDDVLAPVPAANVGDRLPGPVDGVFDYSFGNYKLQVLATPTLVAGGLTPEVTRAQRRDELAIATYNVENLDPGDPVAKFDRLAAGVVRNLAAPDIVALEEVQDNTGPTNDATVAADVTYRLLIEAIRRAGGPAYDYRQVDPTDGADGGEPGGNIRVGFLFRTDRGLRFVDRTGSGDTPATTVARHGRAPALSRSPGRIDPTNPAFVDSRKPLAGEFRFRGRTIFVIANHFNSKGGDQPLFGRFQPPVRPSEVRRHAQAAVVRDFVDQIRAVDGRAAVVVLGDINDFEFSTTADILVADGWLTDLPRTLPEPERYTYVYYGNAQVLDHILVSKSLVHAGYSYDIVHLNAEFADQASDHDPQVVRLRR